MIRYSTLWSGCFFFIITYVNLNLFHCDIDQNHISKFVNYVSKLNLDFQLKKRLQELALGIGDVGLVSSYLSYSPEIPASFGVGFLGPLAVWHIFACRENLSSATSDTGKSILHKYLHLFANSLSASGEFVGLSAKGMVRQRKHASVSSPFVQAYFSNPGSSFLKAAKSGVVDNLQGNLDALGCGNCLPMGTSGQFDIIYSEKMQELDKSVDVYGLLEASFGQMDQKMKSEDPSISEIFTQQMQCRI
ncbi:DNA-directed RNA polymerase IV subunit [Trifolium repens]|nr:DNA-directed RNA polymerase IV subunit [Trifolium repens]